MGTVTFRNVDGFILPFMLIAATTLAALGSLTLKRAHALASIHQAEERRCVEEAFLQLNAKQLIHLLQGRLSAEAASAVHRLETERGSASQYVLRHSEGTIPLYSDAGTEKVYFPSAMGTSPMEARWLTVDGGDGNTFSLAWAAEDLSLLHSRIPVPPFWPLPEFSMRKAIPRETLESTLKPLASHIAASLDPVPEGDSLVFAPLTNPWLAPVVRELELAFGIFASGPKESREKTIRLRFYIKGMLWNPYNRTLVLHPRSSRQPAFQVLFTHLPEVRIINRSRGFATGWIRIDAAKNDYTGSQGCLAWVSMPASLEPGEQVSFFEPDPKRQPEGLARTLHPGFPVGPGDAIDIEWRPDDPAGGMHAYLLPMEVDPRKDIPLADLAWSAFTHFPLDFRDLSFPRADAGARPFLLAGGSLAFRPHNTQVSVHLREGPMSALLNTDPRLASKDGQTPWLAADDTWKPPEARVRGSVGDGLSRAEPGERLPLVPARTPFVSWPLRLPENLLEALPLASWEDGFLFGSPHGRRWNAFAADTLWAVQLRSQDQAVSLQDVSGQKHLYYPVLALNCPLGEVWESVLKASGTLSGSGRHLTYEPYIWSGDDDGEGFEWSTGQVRAAAESMASLAASQPLASVAELFNSGRLPSAFPRIPATSLVHDLLPLRAWLRASPPIAHRGSAWVLHLAVSTVREGIRRETFLRYWLLDLAPEGAEPQWTVIRRHRWPS